MSQHVLCIIESAIDGDEAQFETEMSGRNWAPVRGTRAFYRCFDSEFDDHFLIESAEADLEAVAATCGLPSPDAVLAIS